MARKKTYDRSAKNAFASKWPLFLGALLVIVIFGRTIDFDFVLDDELFIVNNPLVKQGLGGILPAFGQGSLEHFKGSNFQVYRPIMIAAFCLQKALFGFTPAGFHFVNIVLYAIVCLLVFRLYERLFSPTNASYGLFAMLLFLVHPIHTEVVANVKGQDELLAAMFNLGALLLFANALGDPSKRMLRLGQATLLYLMGLFSKESSVAFLVVFPLWMVLVAKQRDLRTLLMLVPFAIAALVFLAARQAAISHIDPEIETSVLENVLYGANGAAEHTATVAAILWQFIRLTLVPHPLSWDYSFNQIPLTDWTTAQPWMAVCAFSLIVVLLLVNIKRQPSITFGLLFFVVMIAPTSNIFFLNGTTFAERFLFLPSVGLLASIILMLPTYGEKLLRNVGDTPVRIAGIAVLVVFSALAIDRVGDWRNNHAVFVSGAAHSPNSSRTNAGLGTHYMNLAEKETNPVRRNTYADSAVASFERSLAIMPDNWNSSYKLGLIKSIRGDTTSAMRLYRSSIAARPNVYTLNNLGSIHSARRQSDSALYYFRQALEIDPKNTMALTNLCVVHFQRNELDQVIQYGEQAVALGNRNKKLLDLLAAAHARKGNGEQAGYYTKLAADAANRQ